MNETEFDSMLSDAITEALSQLGETVKQTIYYYLEKSFNMKMSEIPHRPVEFANAISALLGPGSAPLEGTILRNLYTRIDVRITVQPQSQDARFIDFIRRAAELYQSIPTDRTAPPP